MANIPEGYEIIPEGYEIVKEAEEALGPLQHIKQPVKNAVGGLDAAVSMIAGVPSMITGGLSGLGNLMMTGDVVRAGQAVRDVQESNFGFGAPRPITNEGQQVTDMLTEGTEYVKGKAGDAGAKIPLAGDWGRVNAEIAAEMGLNFLPIPGGKGVRKLANKIEQNIGPKTQIKIPEGYEKVESEAPVPDDLQYWKERAAQMEAEASKPADTYYVNRHGQALDAETLVKQAEYVRQRNAEMEQTRSELLNRQLEDAVQQELPFHSSVEEIAARQPRGLQRDMFVEDWQRQQAFDPYKESQQKALFEEQQARPDVAAEAQKQADIEAAYAQRQKQLVEGMKEEIRLNKEDMLSQLEEKMNKGLGSGMAKRQRGAVDVGGNFLDKVKTRFSKFDVQVEPGAINPDSVMIRLVTPDGKLAGFVDFAKREDGVLVAENAQVAEGLRGKGAAQRMYLAAREAGYDIAPGRVQTDLGNKMVGALQRNGLINKEALGQRFSAGNLNLQPLAGEKLPGYGMGRSQRGAIDFEGITEGLRKLLPQLNQHPDVPAINKIVGNNLIPKDPKASDIVSKALAEGKDTDAYNWTKYTASGSTLEAMTRKSALIQGVSRIVQNAQKRSDLYIQKTVFPVEKMFRQLNIKEVQGLSEVFREEVFGERRFTAEELQAKGMTEKQLRAYAGMRKLFQNTLDIQNMSREAVGLKPITGNEFYMASRWQGDFRQPVRDKEGRLVFYLAADSKLGLNKQKKALLAALPELVIDEKAAHRVHSRGSVSDLQTMYTTMLDVLGRDDPAVGKVREAYEAAMATEASNTLGQLKHAKRKAGIRGFVGDRPGTNAKSESLAMFQEQINYSKNAYKWAALQEASVPLKEILSNEKLVEQQPKNIEYAQEYFKNALGHGEAKWVQAIENAFRETGISPNVVNNGINNAKSFFITQKLAASLGYTYANLIQTINTVPHLMDTMVKMGGNPVKALATGMPLGMAMASGHYINRLGGDFTRYLPHELKFYEDAFRYAEDNGVTSRSIYDEAPITSRGPMARTMSVASKTMTIPETFVRSTAYMTFVQMLKDTKKFDSDTAIFQRAEELTNAAMVDYRAAERPMMFSKLGIAGNALNTLQTYPMNMYKQYRYFGKEAAKGNFLPLATMLGIQFALAGAMGVPGFSDMDKFLGWAKGKLPDEAFAKVKDFDPKLWMIENLGEASVYGALSTQTGVSMTNRLSAPGGVDMIQAPGGPALDLAKQVGNAATAAMNPTSTNVAQFARDSAPTGLQGLVETQMFPNEFSATRGDGSKIWKKASDLADRQGQYVRTPEEVALRAKGLRSQREALSNDVTYKVNQVEKQVDERSKSLSEKYYDAVRRGDMKKVQSIQKLYTELNGHPIRDESMEQQIMEEYMTVMERKAATTQQKLQAIKGVARMKKIMEEHDANNK